MQSLWERKKEAGCSRKTRATDINKRGSEDEQEEDAERRKLLSRRHEKNGYTLLLELTTKEIARSEGSRVCKRGGSQGGTRLSMCGLQAKQTCTMDKHGAAEMWHLQYHTSTLKQQVRRTQDSGRIKQKLGKQKVASAASKQPSTRFGDLSRLRLVRSQLGVRRNGPHGEMGMAG
jgi:hypothetical protein